jgi:small GTP-binding protein
MPEDIERTKREIRHMTETDVVLEDIEKVLARRSKNPKKKTKKKPVKKSRKKAKKKPVKRKPRPKTKPEPGGKVEVSIPKPMVIKPKKGIFSRFSLAFKRVLNKLFWRRKSFRLGIYGPTNAGKTTLANRISMDWLGEEVGSVSEVPHETRQIQTKENIVIKSEDGRELIINLVDTPGIATKIDFEEFVKFGLRKADAKKRAREATQGIIEAIKWLDTMDVVLAVMDSTKSPYNQVNLTILGNLEARHIPVIIVANKMDLKKANIKALQATFPQYKVVGISAMTGTNIDKLYSSIFDVVK